MAQFEKDMEHIKEKVDSTDNKVGAMHKRLDEFLEGMHSQFVKKDEFVFWRNLVVTGMLLSILLGVLTLVFEKIFN